MSNQPLPVQPEHHIAGAGKLVNEFVIADLAMKHLGSYAENDYDFAMAVMRTYQIAQPVQPADIEHVIITLLDHGAGKYRGAASAAQRDKAVSIMRAIGAIK